jgi:hypothetical protein
VTAGELVDHKLQYHREKGTPSFRAINHHIKSHHLASKQISKTMKHLINGTRRTEEEPRRSRINKKHLSSTEDMKTRSRSMQRGKILKLLDKKKKKNLEDIKNIKKAREVKVLGTTPRCAPRREWQEARTKATLQHNVRINNRGIRGSNRLHARAK